jgi:hypothetical protein
MTEEDQEPQGNYLFWALLGTALVIGVGSTAMLDKLAERPELAAADPLLVQVLKGGRILAALLLAWLAGSLLMRWRKR